MKRLMAAVLMVMVALPVYAIDDESADRDTGKLVAGEVTVYETKDDNVAICLTGEIDFANRDDNDHYQQNYGVKVKVNVWNMLNQ